MVSRTLSSPVPAISSFPGAAYFAFECQHHIMLEREAQNARRIDRPRKAQASGRQRREADTHVIGFVADQDDAGMALGARLLDAPLHQRDADAASALVALHRQRPEQ